MSLPTADLSLADAARTLDLVAAEAGELALRWFRLGGKTSARTEYKHGGSPVTEADLAVDAFLAERLRAHFPDAAWLSEETADSDERLARETVIVVDPIDGTRAFADGDARWSVSIALVQALTQIQEITLVFVPKILAILLAMFVFLPSMMQTLVIFMQELADRMIGLG